MEWPKELLEIFDDPLLEGVRPRAAAHYYNNDYIYEKEDNKYKSITYGRFIEEPERENDVCCYDLTTQKRI